MVLKIYSKSVNELIMELERNLMTTSSGEEFNDNILNVHQSHQNYLHSIYIILGIINHIEAIESKGDAEWKLYPNSKFLCKLNEELEYLQGFLKPITHEEQDYTVSLSNPH